MNCQEARELVEDVLDKRLSGSVKRKLDLHLARCLDCRKFYEAERAEHTRWFRAMNDADAEAPNPLPQDFADRLVASVLAKGAAHSHFFHRVRLTRWLKRAACFAVLLSGAAIAAVVVVDAVVVKESRRKEAEESGESGLSGRLNEESQIFESRVASCALNCQLEEAYPEQQSVDCQLNGGNEMNIKQRTAVALASASLVAAPIRSETVPWTAGETLLGDGKIVITYDATDASKVKTLVATPENGEELTVSGGDPMTFADGATITLAASGTVAFAVSVSTVGSLAVERGDGAYLSWTGEATGSLAYLPNQSANRFELFTYDQIKTRSATEWDLDDWEMVSSTLAANEAHDGEVTVKGILRSGYPENPATDKASGVRYVFDSLNLWDGQYTYGARIQMSQKSTTSGFAARLINARRSNRYLDVADGYSLHLLVSSGKASASSWFSPDIPGEKGKTDSIAIDQLTIRRRNAGQACVRFEGETTFGGELDVGLGAEAVYVASASATLANAVGGEGTFRIAAETSGKTVTLGTAFSNVMGHGGSMAFGGGDEELTVIVQSQKAFPPKLYSLLHVYTNANVQLKVTGLNVFTGISGGQCKICVHPGGVLRRTNGDGQIGQYQLLEIDGGSVSLETGNAYQSYMKVMNGGKMTTTVSRYPRAVGGSKDDNLWSISGSSPASIDGANVYGTSSAANAMSSNNRRVFNVNVDDTSDGEFDGTLGTITSGGGNYSFFTMSKYGDGTLKLTGDCKAVRLATTVYGGAILLGANNIMTNEFVLSKGSGLASAANTDNSLGALTVTDGGEITLGSGSTLSFADSSTKTWTGTLRVSDFREKAIRFGSSASALSPDQQKHIKTVEGRRLHLLDDGYLGYHGFILQIR